jgi:hypothetical protein
LPVHSEDGERKITQSGPIGLLAHGSERIEAAPRFYFNVEAWHAGDVASGSAGPDWFRIRPAVRGEVVGDDALRVVPAMLP